jgi:hypothetical protein
VQHELQEAEVDISLRPPVLNPPWSQAEQWRVGAFKTFLSNLIHGIESTNQVGLLHMKKEKNPPNSKPNL